MYLYAYKYIQDGVLFKLFYNYLFVGMSVNVHTQQSVYIGNPRTTFGSRFSLSMTWDLGTQLRSSGLVSSVYLPTEPSH